ncbi:ABC transporter ATP-binding protein [Cellulomonas dongxiuzhuiae]|uniref:ABC transporter ATP-binding protein n=1 Tax=Cellulomonas dongxiuzhuiae TaxID=2819979 RepID=UPI001AAE856A|nr:ABC transporter ATP-binding protein [Cellulomonas dongxiuzhuiae]MBO3089302.1 ABC transporter ATP-binding protein [Cellulomonas dongxiuzhuiae]
MTTATAPPVLVEHVTRRFGAVTALDDVSLRVDAGEIVGLLGPNGAGKTTLLSLVTGLRTPDAGTVRVFGGDPRDPASRTSLGTTPQETGLPDTLKVREVVDFVAGHYADPMPRGEVLARFGLTDMAERQTGALSGGQKRRLAVALSLVGRPRLVLLDEPTTGLDVEARHVLWQALRDYHADGATVIVTSHYLEEIEALAERVVVVGEGRVLADDSLARVLDLVAVRRVSLTLASGGGGDLAGLPGLQDVTDGTAVPGGTRVTLVASDADVLVRALVERSVPFRDLEVRGASLEEAFLSLTSHVEDAGTEPAEPSARTTQPAPEVTR